MNNTFREQTTELQTIFPFKGKGVVNDRLRFDVSGLTANTEYLLSYDTTTGTFAWSTPEDVIGIDTLYTADGTLEAITRTITLVDASSIDIEGAYNEGNSFSFNLENEAVTHRISFICDDGGVYIDTKHINGDEDRTSERSISFEASGSSDAFSITDDYNDVTDDVAKSISFIVGHDLPGIQYEYTLSGTGAADESVITQLSLINEENNDYATLNLALIGTDGANFEIDLSNNSGEWSATLQMGEDLSQGINLYAAANSGDDYARVQIEPDTGNGVTLSHNSATAAAACYLNSIEGANISYNDGTNSAELVAAADAASLTYTGSSYSHILALGDTPYIIIDSAILASQSSSIIGTGAVDVTFPLIGESLYNYTVQVTLVCTAAGNGVGLSTNEAFVG